MALAIIIPGRKMDKLQQRLQALLPGEDIYIYPQLPEPEKIRAAVVWNHPAQIWKELPGLEMVCSFGAGVDHLIFDPFLPEHILVTRIVDPDLTIGMRKYVCMAVLQFHKNFFHFFNLREQKQWGHIQDAQVDIVPGVLGLGVLGADIAIHLHQLGFKVLGFSKKPKRLSGISCLSEAAGEWETFLTGINTLICVLPLTHQTKGLLNKDLFNKLPDQSFLINVGRGQQLVEQDLIDAIQIGKIKAAYLDVFTEEPLPQNHSFWDIPEIMITPHVASVTNPKTAARQIADNYLSLIKGEKLKHIVNVKLGY